MLIRKRPTMQAFFILYASEPSIAISQKNKSPDTVVSGLLIYPFKEFLFIVPFTNSVCAIHRRFRLCGIKRSVIHFLTWFHSYCSTCCSYR